MALLKNSSVAEAMHLYYIAKLARILNEQRHSLSTLHEGHPHSLFLHTDLFTGKTAHSAFSPSSPKADSSGPIKGGLEEMQRTWEMEFPAQTV